MMSYILIMCTFAPPKSEGTPKMAYQNNKIINIFIIQNFLNQKTNEKISIPNRPFHPDGGGKFC